MPDYNKTLELVQKAKNGDGDALQTLTIENSPLIKSIIKRFMRDDGTIKVSRSIKSTNIQINKFVDSYIKEKGDKPTIDEIAKKFALDPQEVVFIMDSARMPISIYTPFEEDENKSLLLIDRYMQDNSGEEIFDNLALKDALKNLEERDKTIILMRYFRDKTQSEIAKELNISQVQVSRLEMKILNKIKEKLS